MRDTASQRFVTVAFLQSFKNSYSPSPSKEQVGTLPTSVRDEVLNQYGIHSHMSSTPQPFNHATSLEPAVQDADHASEAIDGAD
ncbi:unnamed protein product [Heligmosomoides polygyrus]|uniref:DUF4817 domain-containing protein n=1 Tax=Heligmosomoides polygyrus TaxID=6339 RepID=A0A183FKU4_HELPZ|nr:unnamed protein product [Heligmosomoides polygyrus]